MHLINEILPLWLAIAFGASRVFVLVNGAELQNNWQFPLNQQPASNGGRRTQRLAELEREQQFYNQGYRSASSSPISSSSSGGGSQIPSILLFDSRLQQQELDLFHCVEPTRELYENFIDQFNRSFHGDNADKLDRLNLFASTTKRIIMFNRIIQNELFNQTNYQVKPTSLRNYHFISPLLPPNNNNNNNNNNKNVNLNLWYSDITDCELGLVKYILFDIFYLIDKDDLATAYKVALDNSEHLPLLEADGFEQLANILLVRLYDRFKGDEKMDQLFQWPLYLKKLAGYAYNRAQAAQPDFKSKLPLITFAYPSYFKDLKYNSPAVNRTTDNIKAHQQHEKFNKLLGRKFDNLQEKNKRLAIFRQHWTMVNLLNNKHNDWNASSIEPDWIRAPAKLDRDSLVSYGVSEKLRASSESDTITGDEQLSGQSSSNFKHTQFSDLTDVEFVAFLTNDYSLLDNNEQSIRFIESNFPIRQLDEKFKRELALELELRRGLNNLNNNNNNDPQSYEAELRSQNLLARKVIEELISDVGLPIGSVAQSDLSENEHLNAFLGVANFFTKPYHSQSSSSSSLGTNNIIARLSAGASSAPPPSESDWVEERQRRYDRFKINYGRFRAWFIKEGWLNLGEQQQVAMLRLADLSWPEIKLTMFKLCCLNEDSLMQLSSSNATIAYLSSNQFMCQQLEPATNSDEQVPFPLDGAAGGGGSNVDAMESNNIRELNALELYYYYSVHFNKHHSNMDTFAKRFAIFRHNIDTIRKHSCDRSVTLYKSLKERRSFDSLNNIDTLDPRRSYTDDINLDRYKYFSLPNLSRAPPGGDYQQQARNARMRTPYQEQWNPTQTDNGRGRAALSRAGISYRREPFFSSLLENGSQLARNTQLKQSNNNNNNPQLMSRQNLLIQRRIYELVMQRYKYCMKTVRQIELDPNVYMPQQCQANGLLADRAINLSWNSSPESQFNSEASLQLQKEDQCAFYRLGLEPWAEGLIKQDPLSSQLIQTAKC